jgi:hypothetical protein
VALAWWLIPCLPFPGLLHIYFLFTVWLRIFHVCRNENFCNSYLRFYWKKWFYIWYMTFAWRLVPCLPFPGLLHIYFLFIVWLRIFQEMILYLIYGECWDIYKFDTNERVGVFLARRSVQHLVSNGHHLEWKVGLLDTKTIQAKLFYFGSIVAEEKI